MSTYTVAGSCGRCGAPYYVPSVWMGVLPPPPMPSCACWSSHGTVATTTITVPLPNTAKPNYLAVAHATEK